MGPPSTDSQQTTVQYAWGEDLNDTLSVDNEALYDLYRTSKSWATGTVEAPTSLWDPLLWIAWKKPCNMRALRGLNDPLSVDNEAIYIFSSFQTLDDSSYHYQASTHPHPPGFGKISSAIGSYHTAFLVPSRPPPFW